MHGISRWIAGALLAASLAGCPSKEGEEQPAPAPFDANALASSYYEIADAVPGFLARRGQRLLLEQDGKGVYVTGSSAAAMRWSVQDARLVLDFSPLLELDATCSEHLSSLPDPPITPAVAAAYRTEKGTSMVPCIAGTARITLTRLAGTVGFEAVRVESLYVLTHPPFTVGGVTYELTPKELKTTWTAKLRATQPTAPVPFTEEDLVGTWAMDLYHPAYRTRSTDAALATDFLTFTDGHTGTAALTGKTFSWRITVEGDLELTFPDGSTQRSRILDTAAPVFGVFTEHRDSSGALLAGSYGHAMEQPAGSRFLAAELATGPQQYWQTLLNAWSPELWEDGALRWEERFGWVLESGSSATRLMGLIDANTGAREVGEVPMTWSITDQGELRIVRACPSDPECRYRLWSPLGRSEDGGRLFVLEREYERASTTAPYANSVFVRPRINFYDRMARPIP